MALRFGWGFFRDLVDWTPATVSTYGNPQVKADFLRLAADAPTTVSPAVTAFAGGGQGSATALTADFSNITTCATAGDSVKLPAATVGKTYTVTNRGAASANVFPATGDTINGGSANAAIALPVGATYEFVAINSTDWKTNTVTASAGDGTVALPSHTFSADSDTGIYRIGANNIGVAANGAKVLDIATTGLGVTGALSATTTVSATTILSTGAGLVTAPSLVVGANDNGQYEVSSTQQGFSIGNALVGGYNASGLFTGVVSEQVAAAGVAVDGALLKDGLHITKATPVAINVTAAATAAEIVSGYITSTSAAAVAITTPTATAIAALIGAVRGTSFDLVIDNSLGANTVTLTLDASIAVVTPAVTGGDTLTVSTANAVGVFRIVFISGTAAKIFRIA